MNCNGCLYAEWKRTSNGRLHPDKMGRCTYLDKHPLDLEKKLPSAFRPRHPLDFGLGFIERGSELPRKCAFKTGEQLWGTKE
jgi:hypothetical protein